MSPLTIRKAELADVAALSSLLTKAWRDTYEGLLSDAYIENIIEQWYTPQRVTEDILVAQQVSEEGYFVAVLEGQIVGTIGGGMVGENTHEIFVLYLDPARKRQGIGSALVAELTTRAVRTGATRQQVCVQEGNLKGIPFYEALGFRFADVRRPGNLLYIRELEKCFIQQESCQQPRNEQSV